jgi:ribosomal-protein-alanine N-acetyltransferase
MNISEAAGVKVYTLEVRASDESAISLYKDLGFIESGIRKKYYEDNNEDAVIMWKN